MKESALRQRSASGVKLQLRAAPGGSASERPFLPFFFGLLVIAVTLLWPGVLAAAPAPVPEAIVLWIKGDVKISPAGSANWYDTTTNQILHVGDQLRTSERSRATLRLRDLSVLPVGELTTIRLVEHPRSLGLHLVRGILSFFHRDRPGEIEVEGGGVSAIIRGTEFVFAVDEDGTARMTVIDGVVDLSNAAGTLELKSGEIAVAHPGEPPRKTASLASGDLTAIQWVLYYPAILDLNEMGTNALSDAALQESVRRYRLGNLPQALASHPGRRTPTAPEEKLYLAALLLSLGNIDEAQQWLGELNGQDRVGRLADAHRNLITAVQRKRVSVPAGTDGGMLATELLSASYLFQSQGRLADALRIARHAAEKSPSLGFAWARVAELEFSFGQTRSAQSAVKRARELSPQNAEALSLEGFLLAAGNQMAEARVKFNEAIALDGALGNAWLGRGLTRIRQGDLTGGRADLQVAAAVEPQRSVLRSYLAKAFVDESRGALALHEWSLAQQLDPSDPTVWLYRSLLAREQNRVNDSIRDLARAQSLNDNRGVFRSRLLLDQDRAVSSANQAIAFRDAGLPDIGTQTAARSVALDYGSAPAHQFLADSYAGSERVDLRYESPRASEYLLANLLAPVGGGLLSASLSQQEYSKLFERDGTGLFSQTTYLSRGAWSQNGGVDGTFGNTSFLAEGYHAADPGHVNNDDFQQTAFGLQLKHQIGARDTIYAQALRAELKSGDLARHYDPHSLDPDLRVTERLEPVFLTGWHREWSPQSHTLVLASLVRSSQELRDPTQLLHALEINAAGRVTDAVPLHIEQAYQNDNTLISLEAQQVWQTGRHLSVAGTRYQYGEFDVRNAHGTNDYYIPYVLPSSRTSVEPDMDRIQVYAYDTWRMTPKLHLTAGLSFDHLSFPENFRSAPLTDGRERRMQLSPKFGLLWEASPLVNFRAAYTRSLGGVGFDQSFGLEPTQVAGFNQTFRSLIPESLAGASAAPDLETIRFSVETRPTTNTWLNLTMERLSSDVTRGFGVYAGHPDFAMLPSFVRQHLDFDEAALQLNASQLIGRHLALNARYRLSRAELEERTPAIPSGLDVPNTSENEALLHDVRLSANFNHESGFFATLETVWLRQENGGDITWPDEDVWQFNAVAGYRFARRRAEISVGILNLTDQDYRLNPVSFLPRFERERTFISRLAWRF